jgi:hypothetical protein
MEIKYPVTGEDVAKIVGQWDIYMAAKQLNILKELTPETIAHGSFPVRELLYNSVYYPASAFDGGVIRDCNVNRKEWEVLSFVYCDYGETEEDLHHTVMPRGYRLLGERQVKEEELTPNGWNPEFPPNIDMQHYQRTVSHFAKRPFATWMVFERLPEFDESHGPKRFSLLFLCAEGVATYQALYWTNQMRPRAIAIIQPGTGFGGNWTDFFKKRDPFYWTVKKNPTGMPDYVYCGYWSQYTITRPTDKPEHIHFDWPEYSFYQPAVDYTQRKVFLYKKKFE